MAALMILLLCSSLATLFSNANAIAMREDEKHALLQIKWWNISNIPYNFSDPCDWEGIHCNDFGSIVKIIQPMIPLQPRRLADLNFTAFPNLEHLRLQGGLLTGIIHNYIGVFCNLIYLELSCNDLTDDELCTFHS